jgi:hypothetical protein
MSTAAKAEETFAQAPKHGGSERWRKTSSKQFVGQKRAPSTEGEDLTWTGEKRNGKNGRGKGTRRGENQNTIKHGKKRRFRQRGAGGLRKIVAAAPKHGTSERIDGIELALRERTCVLA